MFMKRITLFVMVLFASLQGVMAQMEIIGNAVHTEGTTHYVVWSTDTKSTWVQDTYDYDFSVPGVLLSYEAKKPSGSTGFTKATAGSSEVIKQTNLTTNFDTYSATISPDARRVSITLGGTLEKKLTNVRVTMGQYLKFQNATGNVQSLDFDSKSLYNTDSKPISFDWCNVDDLVIKSDNENFTVTELADGYSKAGAWGTTTLTINCVHKTAGSNVGAITIESKALGQKLTINVSSNTDKYTPSIIWNVPAYMQVGEVIENAVSRGAAVVDLTLASADAAVIVDGTTITANKVGTVELTATIAEMPEYKSITETKVITIGNKVRQGIIWDQTLDVPSSTVTVALTATSDKGLPIVYSSSDEKVATVNGSTLIIQGAGSAVITANQEGDEKCFPVSATKILTVYDICDALLIDDDGSSNESGWYTIKQDLVAEGNATTKVFAWDAAKSASHLVFDVWADYDENVYKDVTLYIDVYRTTETGEQYEEGWKTILVPQTNPESCTVDFDVEKDKDIHKIVFRVKYKSAKWQVVSVDNIKVYKVNYVTADVEEVLFSDITLNASETEDVTFTYADMCRVSLDKEDGVFSIADGITFGEVCGSKGSETVQVQFSSQNLLVDQCGTYENVLVVKNSQGIDVLRIPIRGTVKDYNVRNLPVMPTIDAEAERNVYGNFFYMERLKGDVSKTTIDYTSLNTEEDVKILDSQYMLLQVQSGDKWRTFVPPFDVHKAYVIELVPEPTENVESEDTRAKMIKAQEEEVTKLYQDIQKNCQNGKSLKALIEDYLTQVSTVETKGGILPLEHYYKGENAWTFNYFLYESGDSWKLAEDESMFVKDWRDIPLPQTSTDKIMERGKTYSMNFPYCMECPGYAGWDYWTGKLVLLEHIGEQVIQGSHGTMDFRLPNEIGTAMFVGNSFFGDLQLDDWENVYVHDTSDDMYKPITQNLSGVTIYPTQSMIYADVTNSKGKRARAIRRTGEIIWETDGSDTTTDLADADASGFVAVAAPGGMRLTSTATEAVAVYGISGALLYAGTVGADAQVFVPAEAGLYIVRTMQEAVKVLVK